MCLPNLRTDVILSCSCAACAAIYYVVVGSCAYFSAFFCACVLLSSYIGE